MHPEVIRIGFEKQPIRKARLESRPRLLHINVAKLFFKNPDEFPYAPLGHPVVAFLASERAVAQDLRFSFGRFSPMPPQF
jgi:hypothetical protein